MPNKHRLITDIEHTRLLVRAHAVARPGRPVHPSHVIVASRRAEGWLGSLNGLIADHVVAIIGTMWCAYAFVALSLFGLPAALAGPKDFVAWASSQFIQLVLLPVIIVAQNRASERDRIKAEADHAAQSHLYDVNDEQLRLLREIAKRLDGRTGGE